jgi:hypothetical protein
MVEDDREDDHLGEHRQEDAIVASVKARVTALSLIKLRVSVSS